MRAKHLIVEARRRAGLTQRDLAERLGTTQSSVARWESGRTSPSWDTVQRILFACGLRLDVALRPDSDGPPDYSNLARTPAERLAGLESFVAMVQVGRRSLRERRRA